MWQARKSRKPIGVADKEYFTQKDGIVTLQYPKEEFPVPDHGRYQLHNEIDDCIVCDKCAKICPVNCIDIEPVRATEEIGVTSDGTSKRIYAAKFDIDMSKCCFCGLCTVVCPTECLTMTKDYDFSVTNLKEHNFEFGDMSDELIAEKKAEFDVFQAAKDKAKAEAAALKASKPQTENSTKEAGMEKPKAVNPAFRPKVKGSENSEGESEKSKGGKPVFKPKVKPKVTEGLEGGEGKTKASKPVFRPKVKKKTDDGEKSLTDEVGQSTENEKPKATKPVFRPKVKKKADDKSKGETEDGHQSTIESQKPIANSDKPMAKFRPKIKPKKKD